MSQPLSDVRVLDLTRLLPGPYATLVLADLGAQVDKLEDPQGDGTRHMGPLVGGESALFYGLNRNKRSIVLDLKRPEGAQALKRLIGRYDVLIESFRPGTLARLGLAYEVLAEENPRLVYCAVTGYGQSGPDRLKAGHDLNYMARAGALGYGGDPSGPPAMPGVQVADIGGALFSLVGVLAALHEQRKSGKGQRVDVSMQEGAIAFLHMHLAARIAAGAASGPLRRGVETLNGGLPCYGVYRTKDGRALAVGALEPKFFSGLLEKLGRQELLGEAYLLGEGAEKVKAALAEVFLEKTQVEWIAFFSGSDVCVEPVLEGDEVLADPQLVAREVFVKAHDAGRRVETMHLRTPLARGEWLKSPPPRLGQHTEEILEEAGFTPDEVKQLLL